MSLPSRGHRVVTSLGVGTFAGVGLIGSVVGGLVVRADPAPEQPRASAMGTAACSAEVLPALAGREGSVVDAARPNLLVGVAADASGTSHPVLWRKKVATRLGTGLEPATPTAINGKGTVVGAGFDPRSGRSVGWVWAAGGVRLLDGGTGDQVVPEDIDDSGRIVGAVEVGEDEQAAVWAASAARPRLLSPLPGDEGAHAFAIAPDGTVGGVSLGDGGTPVVWSPDSRTAQRVAAGSVRGIVFGFDAQSHPVGVTYLADGSSQATVWNERGPSARLATPGSRGAAALASDGGAVVGTTGGAAAGDATRGKATLWASPGRPGEVLPPAQDGPYRGVESAATAIRATPGGPMVFGYSADRVGRRLPTLWRCRG